MTKKKKTIDSIIQDAKENKLKKLDFFSVEEVVSEIPLELFELTSLEELRMESTFMVNKVPKNIRNLTKLKTLSLTGSFSRFPMELLTLPSLKELSIGSDELLTLPKKLNEWSKLSYLNVSNCKKLNKVTGLPPNLTYLYISGNSFKSFPEKIFNLKNLSKLVIPNFKLKEIPKGIYELEDLTSLFIVENELEAISKDILKLTHLKTLWLNKNAFSTFPDIITQIKKLEDLNLSKNSLRSISPHLSNLKKLRRLDLGTNLFENVPPEIFSLENLMELGFGNYTRGPKVNKNKIKEVPIEILQLKKLSRIDFYENPIENVPQEILHESVEAIRNYFRSILEADDEEFLYEAKMVVVGRGDVGKTVLTKKLSNPTYSLTRSETTKGINVLKNPFEFSMSGLKNNKNFRFNIWDFGGQ